MREMQRFVYASSPGKKSDKNCPNKQRNKNLGFLFNTEPAKLECILERLHTFSHRQTPAPLSETAATHLPTAAIPVASFVCLLQFFGVWNMLQKKQKAAVYSALKPLLYITRLQNSTVPSCCSKSLTVW